MFRQLKAFTLIELLIVVAIIAILAAIAVPNFLEAQTRAKTSATRADFSSLATALESYHIDCNTYPAAQWGGSEIGYIGLHKLTSPIAYMSAVPKPHFGVWIEGGSSPTNWYEYGAGKAGVRNSGGYFPGGEWPNNTYLLESAGPTGMEVTRSPTTTSDYPWPGYSHGVPWILGLIYDPTNGTRSRGAIFRTGGAAPPEPEVNMFFSLVKQ